MSAALFAREIALCEREPPFNTVARDEQVADRAPDAAPRSTTSSTVLNASLVPVPVPCGQGGEDRAEIYELLTEFEAGRLTPVEVPFGVVPADATDDMRRVADDMRQLMGLRLAVGEDRPLPYARKWAAQRLGWGKNHRRAGRAIKRLCDAGVIVYAGSLPARGKRDGTKTYLPAALHAEAVENESVGVEPVTTLQPPHELVDQRGVVGAVGAQGLGLGVASGGGTGGGHGHDRDATGPTGGQPAGGHPGASTDRGDR
jgi:hypothetical protein